MPLLTLLKLMPAPSQLSKTLITVLMRCSWQREFEEQKAKQDAKNCEEAHAEKQIEALGRDGNQDTK